MYPLRCERAWVPAWYLPAFQSACLGARVCADTDRDADIYVCIGVCGRVGVGVGRDVSIHVTFYVTLAQWISSLNFCHGS